MKCTDYGGSNEVSACDLEANKYNLSQRFPDCVQRDGNRYAEKEIVKPFVSKILYLI